MELLVCTFRYACLRGYLESAKWLLEIKSDIDISADNDNAFRDACGNGYLKVSKWSIFFHIS